MHFALRSIPRENTPRFGTNIDISVTIDIAHLQFMTAQPLIQQDMFAEAALAEILPSHPPRILPACRQEFLLFVDNNIGPAVTVEIGYR